MYVEVKNWRTESTSRVESVHQHRLVRQTARYQTAQLLVVAEYALDCSNPMPNADGSVDVDLEGL